MLDEQYPCTFNTGAHLPTATVHHGDCLEVMRSLPDNSVDAIVTDPPYGLGFMGKAWDELPPGLEWATECLRVLKPGGHLLAFGGTRTWHRLACAVEDAGFEVRDSIAWLYGSGFPKSHDVSKHIDRIAGAERPRTKEQGTGKGANAWKVEQGGQANHWIADAKARGEKTVLVANDEPITDAARQWQGWGTALKPAFEPVVVARKPLVGTVAANVLTHGTGALNIDATRIGYESSEDERRAREWPRPNVPGRMTGFETASGEGKTGAASHSPAGRWPANVVLDESQAEALDQQSGNRPSSGGAAFARGGYTNASHGLNRDDGREIGYGDTGGASRFFYLADDDPPCWCGAPATGFGVCSAHWDDLPLENLRERFRYVAKAPTRERPKVDGVAHATVKPLALMRWLVRLVTPPGGTVLEPFAGSGTTVEACLLEGFDCVAIEREADYLPLIEARIARVAPEPSLLDLAEEQSA